MSTKYESLNELRIKKKLLKQNVHELEDLLTFKNTKESLSAFTNGLTDPYLKETMNNETGEEKTEIRKDVIAKQLTSEVTNMFIKRNPTMSLASSALSGNLLDSAVKLGAVALVGNYAKKSAKSSNWKQKVIGLALIYVAPYALKFVRKKLEEYQKNRSISSMEQLI